MIYSYPYDNRVNIKSLNHAFNTFFLLFVFHISCMVDVIKWLKAIFSVGVEHLSANAGDGCQGRQRSTVIGS